MQPNGEEDFCGLDRSEFYEAVNSVKASHVGVSTNVVLNKSTYREAKSARATGNFCDEKKGVWSSLLENERRKSSKFYLLCEWIELKVSVIVWATNSSAIDSFVSAEAGLLSIFLKKKIPSYALYIVNE